MMTDETCCGACGYPIHATKDKACDWCRQTANRIEALTAKNARLEQVVEDLSDEVDLAEQEASMVEDDFVKAEKEIKALTAKLAKAVKALRVLIQHAHNCEKELTEELHHQDFCGESLPLTNARATLAEIEGEKT
jgi:septal ring factor EnvC (AmiA/AmiB activator)